MGTEQHDMMDMDMPQQTQDSLLPPMQLAAVPTCYAQLQEEEDARKEDWEDEMEEDEEEDAPFIRYNRAFIAKMSLAEDRLKAYYNIVKNTALSYKGVKSRLSWSCDSYNCGRHQLLKINVRGNGLIVYLALDSTRYAGTKYRYRDVGGKKKFARVPMQIKVRSKRGVRYAMELIADVMAQYDIKQGKVAKVAYAPATESVEMLMQRNLVRVVHTAAGLDESTSLSTMARQAAADVVDVVPKAPIAPTSVNVAQADSRMSDTVAIASVHQERALRRNGKGHKKAVVNIDTIGKAFADGQTVTLEALVAKRLVPAATGWIKVCARGTLDKALEIKANDFSVIAIKMIVLTGGRAVRVKGE